MEIFKLYKTKLTVDNQEDLYRYFKENKDKTNGLIDITHKIIILKEKYFGDNTQSQLFLQINDDPEIKDEFLKFYIRLKQYPKDMMEQIYRLRSDIKNDLIEKKIWVYITTDFKSINQR